MLKQEDKYDQRVLADRDTIFNIVFTSDSTGILTNLSFENRPRGKETWVKIESSVTAYNGFYAGYLNCALQTAGPTKVQRVRSFNPVSREGISNRYAFYVKVPDTSGPVGLKVYLSSDGGFDGRVDGLKYLVLSGK